MKVSEERFILHNSALSMQLKLVNLDNVTAAAVFADANINYGLRCVLLDVSSKGTVRFGSSLILSSGETEDILSSGTSTDIDIVHIQGKRRISTEDYRYSTFIVLYSDVTNYGKLTMTGVQVRCRYKYYPVLLEL